MDNRHRSTVQHLTGVRSKADRAIAVVAHIALVAIVLAASLGFLGVRTANATAGDDRLRLDVTHATITRPGLATPLTIEVASVDGPLPSTLTLVVSSRYLAMFDQNAVTPQPDQTVVGETDTALTFEIPDATPTFRLDFDVRLQPSIRWGRSARISIVGGPSLRIDTVVVP